MVATVAPNADPNVLAAGEKLTAAIMQSSTKLSQDFTSISTKLSKDISTASSTIDKSITQANTKDMTFQEKKDAKETQGRFSAFYQKVTQFGKFMITVARFMPIVKLCIAIILIFTNGLFFLTMLFALILAVILEVIYFVLSLEGLIHIIWFFYWLGTVFLPFLVYVGFFLAILLLITVICLVIALINLMGDGFLNSIILCQNSPASWYKVPFFHKSNQYSRGIMCSRPCRERYAPDEMRSKCMKIPKEAPSYCPQAQVMRFYTGDGKDDSNYIYIGLKTKGNMKYLTKLPEDREAMLLESFVKKKSFSDDCNNKENKMEQYNAVTTSICANVMQKTDIFKMDDATLLKIKSVCNQSFCNSRSTYPFCTGLVSSQGFSGEDLIRSIIIAAMGVMTFIIAVTFVFTVLNMRKD